MISATDPWTPLGQLLADQLTGDGHAEGVVVWEDGSRMPLPGAVFFRRPEAFSGAEAAAVELCRGRVLDAGAGAGCHALALQDEGYDVRALDVCSQAVEVMSRRGVREARKGDLFAETARDYDTLLMLMNGAGLAGDLAGLDRLFTVADRILAEDGQILLDSADLRVTDDLDELGRLVQRVEAGRYRGESRQRIEYRGRCGPPFPWLYVDSRTLRKVARRHGWISRLAYQGDDGTYLARLTRAG